MGASKPVSEHVADHQNLDLAESLVAVLLVFRLRRNQKFVEQLLALALAQVQGLDVFGVVLRRLGDHRHHTSSPNRSRKAVA
jgi:hypothetical protein